MWTVSVTPEASVLKKLVSTPLLLMLQAGVAGLLAAIPHVTPEPVGSRSLTLTLLAAPGPVLLSVTVNPICWPALTVDASAALLMPRPGHCTVTVSVALPLPSLAVVKLAVLGYVPQLS